MRAIPRPRILLWSGMLLIGVRLYAENRPGIVEFAPENTRAVTVPAENGTALQANFNGQGPIHVVFDTGSSNIMSSSLARKLGLSVGGTGSIDAMGGTVPAKGTVVDSVRIGRVTLHHQVFAVIDLPSGADEEIAFIGDQWLQLLPIRIDFEHQRLTFYNPRFFHYSNKGSSLPIHFEKNAVIVEAAVDGIRGQFEIDSGSIHSLLLNAPFVTQHDLIRNYGATVRGYAGEGFGGQDTGLYTRARELRLSDLAVNLPITVLLEDTQGAGASHLAGNIGLRILKRFTIIFDGPKSRLYLEKSAAYNTPDIFNRAGLVVDPDPDNARVRMVFPGSPAAEAGIVEDDVITQIDGRPPTDDSLENAFLRAPGTRLRLTVRHSETVLTVSIALRNVL